MCTNFILLFSLALEETHAVIKIIFGALTHALGLNNGQKTFRFEGTPKLFYSLSSTGFSFFSVPNDEAICFS